MILHVEARAQSPNDPTWLRGTPEHYRQCGATVVKRVAKQPYYSVNIVYGTMRCMEKAATIQQCAKPDSFKPVIGPWDFDHAARPWVAGKLWHAPVDPWTVERGVVGDAYG